MFLDILLLIVIAAIVAIAAAEGLVRTLVMTLSFYVLTIILGMVVVALNLAQVLSDAVIGSLQSGPTTPLFYQGMVFIGLLAPAFFLAIILGHSALENSAIKALGWGDNALGTLVGVALGLAFAAVLCNSWGVIVSEQWQPIQTWHTLRVAYENSVLRPYMMSILTVYRRLLFPFSISGYPVFFVPQG